MSPNAHYLTVCLEEILLLMLVPYSTLEKIIQPRQMLMRRFPQVLICISKPITMP